MTKPRHHLIEQLVTNINEQLGWGKAQDWTNKDFEQLSWQIFDRTQKKLSVTTLKRIWGRAELVAKPSNTTLDILAEFEGHKNWRDFVKEYTPLPDSPETEKTQRSSQSLKIWKKALLLIGIGAVLLFLWTASSDPPPQMTSPISTNDFKFKSTVVSDDLPNSVVFNYDASQVDDAAKIQIQQDWDSNKRITVSKEDSVATCIYYRPGFFKSKLVIDSIIVAQDDVFIKTQDWLGIVQQEPVPIYLINKEINKDKEVSISTDLLKQYDIDPMKDDVTVSLYNVQDFGEIYTHDFELNIDVNNTHNNSRHRCRGIKIFLLFDGTATNVTLSNKGCIANLSMMTFDEYIDGKTHDLSAFGVDFDDFQSVKWVSNNDKLDIYLNDKIVYEMKLPVSPLKIKGISVHFSGAGAVRNFSLKNKHGLSYTSAE